MSRTVAIVGLGQIGSSLGAAIRKRRLARVIGVARRAATRSQALRIRAVQEATSSLSAVAGADIVILATPIRQIIESIPKIAKHMKPGAVLTDVGSTKKEIVEAAKLLESPEFSFIAGHPMAGNEKQGIAGCDPDLFEDRPYILLPSIVTRPRHIKWMDDLTRGLGARTHWLDSPDEHDRIAASVSQLPYLIAYSLMQDNSDDRLLNLAGNSFRDLTRVASSAPEMVLDFLLTNRLHLQAVTRTFQKTLTALSRAVARGDRRSLKRIFDRARSRRETLQP